MLPPSQHSGMSAMVRWAAALLLLPATLSGHQCALLTQSIRSCFQGVKPFVSPQFSALDVLAGMMMKGAAKCDKHAE